MTTDAAEREAGPLDRSLQALRGSAPARYGVAPAVVGLAIGLQYLLWRKPVVPFVLFYLAVAAAAAIAGRGPGILAATLGAAAGNYFFLEPYGAWSLSSAALLGTGFFLGSASLIAALIGSLGGALSSADATAERLRSSETAHRNANDLLSLALAVARSGSFWWDAQHDRNVWSDELLALYGFRQGEFGGRQEDWLESLVPEDREAGASAVRTSLETGHFHLEFRIRRRDTGEVRWMEGRARVFFDESHRPERMVGINVDITERKRAEQALAAERMRWRGVVEGIADEVWVGDREGKITLINLPDATLMGLTEFKDRRIDEVIQELDILYPDGRPRPPEEAPLLRSLRTGEVLRGEELMRHRASGKTRRRQYSCAPTRDESGAITGSVAIVRDVTHVKETEEALREADRRKDEFLAVLSHELRNPLAPIRNSLYVLDRAPDGEQARRAKAVIERQVTQLTRLVSDLLDVSRIARGKVTLHRERLDLREVVSRTVEDHRSLFDARGIHLELSATDRSIFMDGDPVRLGQVLGNLLQNAAKFTGEGGTVAVSSRLDEPGAVLQVRDTGVGIAPDMLPRLFSPFAQADRTLDRSAGGLGLGLALAKGLVELHGGEIRASSGGAGLGAEFTVILPAALDPVVPARPHLEPVASPVKRVLIIEDNVDAAESLREVLELLQHRVSVAFSGPEGIQKARAIEPDIVLCDIGLPGMDGYAIARAFRADPQLRTARLVALTGYALAEDQLKATAAGFDQHVAKPPDLRALTRALLGEPDDHGHERSRAPR